MNGLKTEPNIKIPLTKAEIAAQFSEKTDEDKIAQIIAEKQAQLDEQALNEKIATFQQARQDALEAQRIEGLAEVEVVRVKVYKEKLDLEQKWNDAQMTGTWEVPV